MLFFHKKAKKPPTPDFGRLLQTLAQNEIRLTPTKATGGGSPCRSKFGGKPALPADFSWPRFSFRSDGGCEESLPLSFLCQINLAEVAPFDRGHLLPEKGLLLFFYEQETMRWGFDPADNGCSRVYCFADTADLSPFAPPDDLKEGYRLPEFDLSFDTGISYPRHEELHLHDTADCRWGDYEDALEKAGYDCTCERHKLLGYADILQNEMLTECERTARGLASGSPADYADTTREDEEAVRRAAPEWTLLFQMASLREDGFEVLFGDLGNLYFYIRKADLRDKRFDRVRFVLQCG